MEIFLKMDPRYVAQKEKQLLVKQFGVSHACGYLFDSFQAPIYKSVEEQKSTLASQNNIAQSSLQKMVQAYNGHRIDEAYKYRTEYLKYLKQTENKIQDKHQALIENIKQQMHDVWEYEKELNIKEWIHKKDGKHYKLFTKHFQETVAVLIEADLQVPIEKFIFVVNEFDLMKDFMPFMEYSAQVKEISRNCKIGHIVNDFPIISKRQAFFQGIGYDRMNHDGSIFLYSRSLHNRKDLQQKLGYKVHTLEKAIQLQYKFFMVQYKPSSREKGKIRIAMNVDMKLSIPKFILDPATQNFGKDFLKNVLKVTKHFEGSKWQQRSIQKKQFTDFIKLTIERYFPS